MGWIAITKSGEILREEVDGRPVQEGEEGNLKFIFQEDFGNKVAVDLVNGVIIINYDDWALQGEDIQIQNPKTVLYICTETIIVGELSHTTASLPDKKGDFFYTHTPLTWRPIWFTRYVQGMPTKVIGAQTTLPEDYGGKNVKKLVSIFERGTIGID